MVTTVQLPPLPALVTGSVEHKRRGPVRHEFKNRVYQWLVDIDDLPQMPRLLRAFSTIHAADHIGSPEMSLRDNIEQFCAAHGTDVSADTIVLLTNARVLGYTFDPLSVFWCLSPDLSVHCIVAEVHNTYGERHAYLLDPDDAGRATTDKEFYVSPFFTVDGSYDLQFTLGATSVSSTVVLHQGGQRVFGASLEGTPAKATKRQLVKLIITMPLMTHRITVLIRIHGIWLWLRRLPVVPRRPHRSKERTG